MKTEEGLIGKLLTEDMLSKLTQYTLVKEDPQENWKSVPKSLIKALKSDLNRYKGKIKKAAPIPAFFIGYELQLENLDEQSVIIPYNYAFRIARS